MQPVAQVLKEGQSATKTHPYHFIDVQMLPKLDLGSMEYIITLLLNLKVLDKHYIKTSCTVVS